VVAAIVPILRDYRIAEVTGDRYSGQWVVEAFEEHGITYTPSTRTRSELYLEFLAMINSKRVRLPLLVRLRQQFTGLERRTARSGKDSVDHHPGQHDDLSNSVAGACVVAASEAALPREPWVCFVPYDKTDPLESAWEARCFARPRGFGGS